MLGFLYPDVKLKAIAVIEDMHTMHGMEMGTTQTIRTFDEQEKNYAQGRFSPGKIITKARAGISKHHYGLAFDAKFLGKDPYLANIKDGAFYWKEYGKLVRKHGLTWGGDFDSIVDEPHAELAYGFSIAEIVRIYRAGGNAAVWGAMDWARGVPHGDGWLVSNIISKPIDVGALPI